MSRAQRPQGRAVRPSKKPLFVVAGLLMSAALGAAVTTRPIPGPVRHTPPVHPIVVDHLSHSSGTGRQLDGGQSWI
jgi:hypothetical protein